MCDIFIFLRRLAVIPLRSLCVAPEHTVASPGTQNDVQESSWQPASSPFLYFDIFEQQTAEAI